MWLIYLNNLKKSSLRNFKGFKIIFKIFNFDNFINIIYTNFVFLQLDL